MNFSKFAASHQKRTALVVTPIMLTELVTTIILCFPSSVFSLPEKILTAGLLALIWISTFTLQVPLHLKLKKSFNERDIGLLIKTNWIRTISWTGRVLFLIVYVA